MPLQATSGTASYDAFGGGVAVEPVYIEQIFQTYLYTGNDSTQTITNGIDESGKGAMTWIKCRSASTRQAIYDTVRGATKQINANETSAQSTNTDGLQSFTSTGFTVGPDSSVNASAFAGGGNYASWTFRKQPKFYTQGTYTGNGSVRTISHDLGSVPGVVLIKCTSSGGTDWMVFHRSASDGYFYLNDTAAKMTAGAATFFGNGTSVVAPDATSIYLGSGDSQINQSGLSYVYYVFAHDAGGFGLTGTDNVISCGSYGSNTTDVNLGYEPQWIMIKNTTSGIAYAGWAVFDNMRGLSMVSTSNPALLANSSTAEYGTYNGAEDYLTPTATGFKLGAGTTLVGGAGSSGTWIYIAIRRGPMKVPTSGTSVFNIVSRTGTGATATVTGVGFPVDLVFAKNQSNVTFYWDWIDRLRGPDRNLFSNATDAEYSNATVAYQSLTSFANMDGVVLGADGWNAYINGASNPYTNYFWRRAPSFFDEVCYTGTGSATTQAHNLGAVPELMILKPRSNGSNGWCVYSATVGNTGRLLLDTSDAAITGYSVFWNSTTPTSTVFSLGTAALTNESATTFVAYLFATCAGVSKVFSYTGNGSSQTINCGFTGGARWILIKRTDSTGDWYVWDSARGIVSGNDPHLSLNSTAAEVTTDDTIDTDSTGFVVNQVSATNVNVSSATYIGIAIA